ncbi:MAG: DUF1926 domain-containing protein [Candidatus Omnitrophica bacterium]|nr:DUF1926 domain-containing protein [Candidatus Omnitrophota bacterium]
MNPSVTFLMAFHCHQPVGNFGFVFEEAYAKAYDPFLGVLERHPDVRLALHYSGCLLDWLLEHRPAFVQRLRALVTRGQIELLASGYYEPILPLIPEADRQGQIAQMRHALRAHCRAEATGLWLTERVWEPDLPSTLAQAGIRYTMVDTNQFAGARPWLPARVQVHDDAFWDLLGSYETEYAGASVRLFPASKRLRYSMPFQPVPQTIDFLKRLKRDEPFDSRCSLRANGEPVEPEPVAITFADDGEKFGLWPKTYAWVYEEGWLDQFFTALERERAWLRTTTFADYAHTTAPDGTVYLPCGSYEEMLEWSGGYFRNFFTKYPEANAMLQKMLHVSQAIAQSKQAGLQATGSKRQAKNKRPAAGGLQLEAKRREALLRDAEQALYTGQCNCAYWHGVFGGLYLSHLRRAVYAHLISAEQLLNQVEAIGPSITIFDADGDGRDDVSLKTATTGLVIDPADGGTITEWSLYGANVNLLDTLARRPEPYHDKLRSKQPERAATSSGQQTPASIHDLVAVKEENLASHLIYDDHRRSAFLDYALEGMPTLERVVRSTWGERRLWSGGSFALEKPPTRGARKATMLDVSMVRLLETGSIRKSIRLHAKTSVVECGYRLEGLDVPVIALEWNVSLRDERYLATPREYAEATQFGLEDPHAGVALTLSMDRPARLLHFPIETVSESEHGLERTYQGLCIVCLWTLEGARSWETRLQWSATTR